jgi:hypothetical protein
LPKTSTNNLVYDLDCFPSKAPSLIFISDDLRIGGLQELAPPNITEDVYLLKSRDADVNAVESWLEDDGQFAIWINGAAGLGKSVLARHLADLLRRSTRLACLVDLKVNSHLHLSILVRMMAHELTMLYPRCRDALIEEVKRDRS